MPSGDVAWVVTRYDDVRVVLTDDRFSRRVGRPGAARLTPEGGFGDFDSNSVANVLNDPPGHTRWRRLVGAALPPRRVERLRGTVQTVTDQLLHEAGRRTQPVDLVQALAIPLPITAICELLGAPAEDRRPLWQWTETILSIHRRDWDEIRLARQQLRDYIRSLTVASRDGAAESLVAALVAVRDQAGGLTDEELIHTITALIVGGWGTTTAYLAGAVHLLLAFPDEVAALQRNPDLIPPMVEEALRFAGGLAPGFGLPRYATVEVEVGGTTIPAGSVVLAEVESANRDDRQFRDAGRFDCRRADNRHLTFGAGRHHCLGSALARMQLQVAIERLLVCYPQARLAVRPEEVPIGFTLAAQGPETLPVDLRAERPAVRRSPRP